MSELTMRFTFTSDWGVGTGSGRHGSLDRVVAVDELGLPMLPAKTVTGVLRDAAEQAARGLASGGGDWQAWVDWLFGSSPASTVHATQAPRPAALQVRPGRLEELRALVLAAPTSDPPGQGTGPRQLLTKAELAGATTVVRPGVRIAANGVAADDTLRMDQYARAGLTVTARGSVPGGLPREAALLLMLASRLVTAVGGRRRRGPGACELTIAGLPQLTRDEAQRLAEQPHEPPEPPAMPSGPASRGAAAPPADGPMRLLGQLDITCRTPVAISRATVSNTVLSLDYIPGGNLLPIIAAAVGAGTRELIREGRIVVTDATIVRSGVRTLALPRALQAPKRAPKDSPLTNTLMGAPTRVMAVPGYLALPGAGELPSVHEVDLVENAHAVIDDAVQRPTTSSGGLFVQQAIAAGTTLRAQLWADADLTLELPQEAAVGRAKKDDYGQVGLSFSPVSRPAGPAAEPECRCLPGGELRVWLTADTLLATNGRADPSVDALAREIGAKIDRTLQVLDASNVTWRRHETWSAAWGLPRPSLVALAAGSVVVLSGATCADGDCPSAALAALEASGVGLRQAEGFGRVWCNPPALAAAELQRRAPTPDDAQPPSSATPPRVSQRGRSVSELTDQAWKLIVADAARAFAADPEKRATVIPHAVTKAQLGALRSVVAALAADPQAHAQADPAPGRALAVAWLASLQPGALGGNAARAQKWRRDDMEPAIGRWLGLDDGKSARQKYRARLGEALGIAPEVLGSRRAVESHARTALLLECISAATRAKQAAQQAEGGAR